MPGYPPVLMSGIMLFLAVSNAASCGAGAAGVSLLLSAFGVPIEPLVRCAAVYGTGISLIGLAGSVALQIAFEKAGRHHGKELLEMPTAWAIIITATLASFFGTTGAVYYGALIGRELLRIALKNILAE